VAVVLFTASRRNNFVGGTCALPSALLVKLLFLWTKQMVVEIDIFSRDHAWWDWSRHGWRTGWSSKTKLMTLQFYPGKVTTPRTTVWPPRRWTLYSRRDQPGLTATCPNTRTLYQHSILGVGRWHCHWDRSSSRIRSASECFQQVSSSPWWWSTDSSPVKSADNTRKLEKLQRWK